MTQTERSAQYASTYAASSAVWTDCVQANDVDMWLERLDRLEIADHLAFLEAQGATRLDGAEVPLEIWLSAISRRAIGPSSKVSTDTERSIEDRLASATFDWWLGGIERLLNTPEIRDNQLPRRGVVHYYSDHLRLCVLFSYRVVGSAVELLDLFPLPSPRSFSDPLHALRHAKSDTDLDILRRSLYSRHKVVIQRNTLIHVDREHEVFGPSIDTLFLNDWLFDNRYLPQRSIDNAIYFEEILPKQISAETWELGSKFLEIGCGNGLLTATYARNEVMIRAFTSIDIAADAVATTHRNSAHQRLIYRGIMGDRGIYQIARYSTESIVTPFDLVVCNPPYIPRPPDGTSKHPLASATIGTELLSQVVHDSSRLIKLGGELIIVASTMAEPELISAIPHGMSCVRMTEVTVPFQIEAVQSEGNGEYIEWLETDRGLRRLTNDAGASRGYEHTVAIWRLTHTSGGE